jgi:hypothetical protein
MKRFKIKAEKVLLKYRTDGPPIFSYDHAGPHDAGEAQELLEALGIDQTEESRLLLPALSPDFHRVIEHVHAIASKAFNSKLRLTEGRRDVKYYMKMYEEAFYESVHGPSIEADIRELKQLWAHVKKPASAGGSDGDWPPASML